MQWLQDPNHSNVDNLNDISCEAGRHFWNKKKEYLKAKIYGLKTNSETKNIRDLHRGITDCDWVEKTFLSSTECTWG